MSKGKYTPDEEMYKGKHIDDYPEYEPTLKEKLERWVSDYKDIAERHALAETPKESAEYLVSLLKEELKKLTVIGDEKIDKAMEFAIDWAQDYTIRNGKADSIPERQVAQAQLSHTKKEILDLLR